MFDVTSRYHKIEQATVTANAADGRPVIQTYKRRRFVPDPAMYVVLQEHRVAQGERLDGIAARYLGDPSQFWRLCDANAVISPEELEVIGRRVRIAMSRP